MQSCQENIKQSRLSCRIIHILIMQKFKSIELKEIPVK